MKINLERIGNEKSFLSFDVSKMEFHNRHEEARHRTMFILQYFCVCYARLTIPSADCRATLEFDSSETNVSERMIKRHRLT